MFWNQRRVKTRNTEKRVEIACPIDDPQLKNEVMDYFEIMLSDNVKIRKLCSDSNYVSLDTEDEPFIAQEVCMAKAVHQAQLLSEMEELSWFEKMKKWFQNV